MPARLRSLEIGSHNSHSFRLNRSRRKTACTINAWQAVRHDTEPLISGSCRTKMPLPQFFLWSEGSGLIGRLQTGLLVNIYLHNLRT